MRHKPGGSIHSKLKKLAEIEITMDIGICKWGWPQVLGNGHWQHMLGNGPHVLVNGPHVLGNGPYFVYKIIFVILVCNHKFLII